MSYLPEDIRTLVINRITENATTQSTFYRSPSTALNANWPAFILEYADMENQWSETKSDMKIFMFNLYVAYNYDPSSEDSRELAEKAISDSIGELYRDVFEDPNTLNLPNAWLRASNVSWGFGGSDDVPLRMAMMQIEVKVHQTRSA